MVESTQRTSRSPSRATLRSRRRTLADDDIVSQHESLFEGTQRSSLLGGGGSLAGSRKPSAYEKPSNDDEAIISRRTYVNRSFHYFRFFLVMYAGILFGNVIFLRFNIATAMLRMVNQTAIAIQTSNMTELHKNPDETEGEFVWDNRIQQMIMSVYMIAYTLPQIPATKLGLIIGTRWTIAGACLLSNLSALLIPSAAYLGWQWVIVLRLVNGLVAAPVQPLVIELIEKWMPYHELTLGLTCGQVATSFLTTINPLLTGYLTSLHWKYAFYVPSLVGAVLSVLFFLVASDKPDTNWLISEEELRKIKSPACQDDDEDEKSKSNSDEKGTTAVEGSDSDKSQPDVTLFDVIKLPTFSAYLLIRVIYCSSYSGFNFILPRYLQNTQMTSVEQVGFDCFLIQIGHLLSSIWPHFTANFLQKKCNFSKTVAHRICYGVICGIVAATWLCVGIFHSWQTPLLFVNRCFHGSNVIFVTGALMGNFAKVGLSSITVSTINTIGNLSTVATSMLIGYSLDQSGQSRDCWTWIFASLAVSQLVMLLLFSTLVRSGPVHFPVKKNKTKEEPQSNSTVIFDKRDGDTTKVCGVEPKALV